MTQRDGEIVELNGAALDLHGYEAADLLGRNVRTLYCDQADRERFQREIEEQLVRDAFHDALTLLPNRTLFMDRLGAGGGPAATTRRRHAIISAGAPPKLQSGSIQNCHFDHPGWYVRCLQ